MKVKCISDCEGDYRFITEGKEYKAIKEYKVVYGSRNGVELFENRLMIIDDDSKEYPYPLECFDYKEGSVDKPYSEEDYEEAKLQGLDLDNWSDYVRFYKLGIEEEN